MNKEQTVNQIYASISCHGLMPVMSKIFGKNVKFRMEYSKRCTGAPIEELFLTVRSYNALKRAGLNDVGMVVDALCDETLVKTRNLGKKSLREIQIKIVEYGFENLNEAEKKSFIYETVTQNGGF